MPPGARPPGVLSPDDLPPGAFARWRVASPHLRAFAARVRARFGDTPFAPIDLLRACDTAGPDGLEVVCHDDAVVVGSWRLSFPYNDITDIVLHDEWILVVMEGGMYDIPIPYEPGDRVVVTHAVARYVQQGREEHRRAVEARQAPTWNNYFLTIAETHFLWVVFGFFFLVVPVLVLLISALRGSAE